MKGGLKMELVFKIIVTILSIPIFTLSIISYCMSYIADGLIQRVLKSLALACMTIICICFFGFLWISPLPL